MKILICTVILTLAICPFVSAQSPEFDIVIIGGRVIDPETRLDAVRNVGIRGNRIAEITTNEISGVQTIDASGLVVAPGFIDLHVHGRSNKEQEYQVRDGLTTALELEWGIENLGEWYASRRSNALINYGASVCWPFERFKAMAGNEEGLKTLYQKSVAGESRLEDLFNIIGPSYSKNLSADETESMLRNIRNSLEEGGIGIGVPIGYLPETTPEEMYTVYQLAGELDVLVFSHVRAATISAIQEVLANAMLTGAPLHIVHLNSMSLGHIQMALDLVNAAQEEGFDITTEVYPYTAASTLLQSALFEDDWQEKLGMDYNDLQWVETGERLTEKTFNAYRKTGGAVILHMMEPEWINIGIAAPGVIIASDGMPYAPLAHPRTAGTFSRVLGKYVREDNVIDLNTAIEKMTLLPARRLESIAPMMRYKGRIQPEADADITIFDPETIIDKATFESGPVFSEGVEYVIVNGVLVVMEGETLENVFPGQPVYGKFRR